MNIKRYTLAVYLFLATVSIILVLISLNYFNEGSSLQSLFLNLATEIAGAVLIFFIVNRVFALDERDDVRELRLLRKEMQEHFSPFSVTSAKNSSVVFLRNNIPYASHIDFVAYTRVVLLRQNRDLFIEAIKEGVNIRMIIVDHDSKAGEVLLENTNKPEMVKNDYLSVLGFIKDINQAIDAYSGSIGTFNVKLTHWIPGYSMILIRSPKIYLNKAKIDIYSLSFRLADQARRTLLLDGERHMEDIEYFSKQFEALWDYDSYELPVSFA